MALSSALFGILFLFLIFIFSVFIASRFFARKYRSFKPKVSIVVPAYNEGKNIKECLDSVYGLDYPKEKIEVMIVDDGSTDNTLKILQKYKKNKKLNFNVLRQNHLGKVEALNLGIRKSSSEFVLTVDADTVLDKDCLAELLKPLFDRKIGATTGNNNVKNNKHLICAFQNIEYHFSNLIRNSFSTVFDNGIWFSGSLACYRKSVLEEIGYFKKDTLAEDQDVALELKKSGYKALNVPTAFAYTLVPQKVKELYKQRSRWWIGTLQSIVKNKSLFSRKSSPSIIFLYINQFWWSIYAFLSLPLIIYQVNYWMPYNSHSLYDIVMYLFRWFTLYGTFFVIYMIPKWGMAYYTLFAILSGLISVFMIVCSILMWKDKSKVRNAFAIFFYFPYTLLLNAIVTISMLKLIVRQKC